MRAIKAIVLVVLAAVMQVHAASETQAVPRAQVKLGTTPSGTLSVSFSDKSYALPEQMTVAVAAAKEAGFVLGMRSTKAPWELRITGVTHEVVVEANGFDGWAGKIAKGGEGSIQPDFARHIIDVTTPAGNTNELVLRFSDGGKASMSSGSALRYDEFKDHSYYVSASGKVNAENADGQAFLLEAFTPPMTGGPLVEVVGKDGVKHTKRLSPVVMARGAGSLLEKIQLTLQEDKVELQRKGKKVISLPNGTEAVVYVNPEKNTLQWKITKGYVRFGLEEVRCMETQMLTDQNADFQWDNTTGNVDTHNSSDADVFPANRNINCKLSRSLSSSVGPSGTFQYALLDDCDHFVASSYGGDVQMHNTRTGQSFQIAQGILQFSNGRPLIAVTGSQKTQIKLDWADGSPLKVGGPSGVTSVESGSKETLTVSDQGQLALNYSGNGQVTVNSVEGGYTLLPKMLQDWTFELNTGDSVMLSLDGQRGVFTVHTEQGNSAPVAVGSPGGFNPVLYPNSTLTFVIGPGGLTLGQTDGTIVFYESAGAEASGYGAGPMTPPTPSGGTLPPVFGSSLGTFDSTLLIQQPPVTVFN